MTYLHDFITARKGLREKVIPKLIAALMPTMDMLGIEYVAMYENHPTTGDQVDGLRVTGEYLGLPDGYVMRIDFYPVKMAEWKETNPNTKAGF